MEKEEKSRKRRKSQYKKKTFPIVVFLSITAITITGIFIYDRVSIGVNRGNIGFCMQDEKLLVSWQSVSDRNIYRLSRYDEASGEYILCGEYAGGRAELTDVVPGQELTLKMQGVRTINVFGQDREIAGTPRILTVVPEKLDCPILTKTADLENRSMKITWDTEPDNRYEVFLMNEEGTLELYAETENGEITFSMENRTELSGRERVLCIAVRTIRRMDDHMLYGATSDLTEINRADLMDGEVHLKYTDNGKRHYTLSWQESKGDWYELQEWSFCDKKWIGRQVYRWSDTLSYDTGKLPSCTKMRFRVITYNDTEMRDREEFAAEPSEVTFRTQLSPVYCTVWPLTALHISEDISGENVIGQVPAGKALCVLEETEGRFLVWYEDKYGYIDSGYCLIDLTEYLGNLCEYNITNSYSSVFRVHEYDIPEVTDRVIKGYENIHMENGQMLVPYLYPCAQKLYQAALHAEGDGYFLRIYDAFRPNEATRYLYDMTEVILDKPVPEKDEEDEEITGDEENAEDEEAEDTENVKNVVTVSPQEETNEAVKESNGLPEELTGEPNALLGLLMEELPEELPEELMERVTLFLEELESGSLEMLRGLSEEALPAFYILPQELLTDGSLMRSEILDKNTAAVAALLLPEELTMIQSLSPEDILVLKGMSWEELAALKSYADSMLTYRGVMTDNRFRLGSFLAQSVSTHNRGIALDLTLVKAASEEELEMQSDMHDLSWYSILTLNNENADLLSFYMKGAGYNGLSSEWWHFQDDETRNQLHLGYMENGISPEGWKRDELGWKYRLADGSCYCADTVMIDKKDRTFNEDGYLVEE